MMNKNKGFTLVEVLIVVAILGILASALIAAINPIAQLQKGRDAERVTDLKKIQAALELYRVDQREYPGSINSSIFFEDNVYLQNTPTDPQSNLNYFYVLITGSTYTITACAENSNSREVEDDTSGNCTEKNLMIQYTSP